MYTCIHAHSAGAFGELNREQKVLSVEYTESLKHLTRVNLGSGVSTSMARPDTCTCISPTFSSCGLNYSQYV